MEAVQAPACQIHHTYKDRWVVSFYDLENKIYLFDSLCIDRQDEHIITSGLSIQLSYFMVTIKKNWKLLFQKSKNKQETLTVVCLLLLMQFHLHLKAQLMQI